MNINYKETQIDFLSHVSGKNEPPVSPRYMAARISLSSENLVILMIVAIMVVIFSFSMGIERGKNVAVAQPQGKMTVDGNDVASGKTDAKAAQVDVQKARTATPSIPVVAKVRGAVDVKTAIKEQSSLNAAGSGAFTLQVASYKNLKPAQREADQLKQKGFQNVYVLPKGTYTIVCVGKFQNKEDASSVKKQLTGRYQDSRIRRL